MTPNCFTKYSLLMAVNKKHNLAGIFAFVFSCLSMGLFISLCWVAAADAQGAIAFFVYAPVLLVLSVVSFFLGRYAGATSSIGKVAKKASIALAFFYLVFYISPYVGLGSVTDEVIGIVAKSFKVITGKSPMEWDKNL